MMDQAAGVGARILADMSADPYGQFSPSIYETARLVSLAPDLAGHAGRMRFLLTEQNADGGWGRPDSYGLLPTLSATEALLAESHRTGNLKLVLAAGRGLQSVLTRLYAGDETLPDTVAVELLVPGLVLDINAHLDRLGTEPGRRLPYPKGTQPELLRRLREAVENGASLPPKLVHSLEMFGPAAQGVSFVQPGPFGAGCSPAATAAWLGSGAMAAKAPAVRYLETVQSRHGGPVPVAAPLDVFERSWVLATFLDAGLDIAPPPAIVAGLHAAFGESGAPGGAGLPPDADDTATTLHALAMLGSPRSLDCLWAYQKDDHFVTYPDERTPSVTTNAHILQAFLSADSADPQLTGAVRTLTGWLAAQQDDDGSWSDKWHASPYYATASCVTALAGCQDDPVAVRRAVRWVLATQRADGSWGRWEGTPEETAYAVQILVRGSDGRPEPLVEQAAARGCAFLIKTENLPDPPLWHDKDLYTPHRILAAQRIAALSVAAANPRVRRLIKPPLAHPMIKTA
ncbi:prenyltransferase/squalene oxidase repeat-containing protein [Amycolatopsis taiwanensis]|uniref:Squalene cyclase C-terminal domain-containing protein n=1 Tax=Amycolatopsis taiwanensis TaxID=342230 RepID=A0A9W6VIW7_9PSEU|nr:prenyltransferase/squalene oxidase repeat-containing protein [Amycolatopsis taiwanensis]GLY68872.1 hypothetical protein Atai01_54910 [Amycolatopsis taiwanensis]